MREHGLPKVLTWRWTPCAALTLGATAFAGFALLIIPESIGELGTATQNAAARFGSSFASTQVTTAKPSDGSASIHSVSPNGSPATPVAHVAAARPADHPPRRGFSPPLERPEPPPPPPPPTPIVNVQPPPVVDALPQAPPPAATEPAPAQPPGSAETSSAPASEAAVANGSAPEADPNAPPERSAPSQ